MKSLNALLWGILTVLSFALWLSGVAAAQVVTFDPAIYKALADADSPATIPPGTKITIANWQNYKQFMAPSIQAAFKGTYQWHVDGKPIYTMNVGPTVPYPMTTKFVENTEKYGGQAKLEQMPTGGFKWHGYVAGLAFPNPQEPNMGVKIAYNRWADFRPMAAHFFAWNWLVDKYGNVNNLRSDDAFYRLSHLSIPGQPLELPFAKGIFYSSRFMVQEPEQSKYTTELTLQPDDPTRVEEIYVFLPSLRRSLRLSSAARCSPILGTDFIQDDNAWLPSNFKITLLGKKKVLTAIPDHDKAFDRVSYVQPPDSFPGWMKSTAGKWQVRDYYILDMEWLTALGAYCYSHRAFFIDAKTWIAPMAESYDKNGKLWKLLWVMNTPIDYRGQNTQVDIASISMAAGIDFQNSHITATVETPTTTDDNVPGEFRDIAVMTSPGGLARIMK
jgi:Protein of unknown function (DUF1329)